MLREDAAAQPTGSNSHISKGPTSPFDQGQMGAPSAPGESGLRTTSSRRVVLLEDVIPSVEVEPLRLVESSMKSKPLFSLIMFFFYFLSVLTYRPASFQDL